MPVVRAELTHRGHYSCGTIRDRVRYLLSERRRHDPNEERLFPYVCLPQELNVKER